jgi:hypothetical protein
MADRLTIMVTCPFGSATRSGDGATLTTLAEFHIGGIDQDHSEACARIRGCVTSPLPDGLKVFADDPNQETDVDAFGERLTWTTAEELHESLDQAGPPELRGIRMYLQGFNQGHPIVLHWR